MGREAIKSQVNDFFFGAHTNNRIGADRYRFPVVDFPFFRTGRGGAAPLLSISLFSQNYHFVYR